MLDSTVAMLKLLFTLLLVLIQDAPVSILSPQTGDVLRGQAEITGNMDVLNFSSAELAFTYASPNGDAAGPADTLRSNLGQAWFSIQVFSQPMAGPAIAVWDTTSLTDGDYNLRLRVFLQDGTFQEVIVSDLKIRNDTPEPTEIIPTETAFPQFIATLPPPALTGLPATAVIAYPSPTPLPINPASVTTASIYSTFGRGALTVLVLFIFFSSILRLRKNN